MLASEEVSGLMAMMPTFATDDASDVRSTSTVDVDRLHQGLGRMIVDGADVIATTGSFGEFHTLLLEEFRTLSYESVAAAAKRVPMFIGVTSTHTRDVMQKCQIAQDAGADGVLVGVPFYFPSTTENAVRFFRDIGETFPKLNIMIYHNPTLHHIRLSVEAIAEVMKNPAVIAMKDSHRKADELVDLMNITQGKLSVFVHQNQYSHLSKFGARGFWSIDAWMGPWPQLALRDAVRANNSNLADAINAELTPIPSSPIDMSWRETGSKIAVGMAGYVDPGPLRPPFVEVPNYVIEHQKARAERWKALCAKYCRRLEIIK